MPRAPLRLSCVVPAHNEEANLPHFVQALAQAVVRTLMAPDRYGGKFRLQVLVCDFDGQKMAEADSTLFPPT